MERLLAIDPSSAAIGWALWEDGKYARSGVIKGEGFNATVEKVATRIARLPKVETLVIEDMSFHRNPTVMKTINTYAAMVKTLVVMRNPAVEISHVYPQSWQSKLLGASPRMPSPQRKALSQYRARDTAGKHTIGPDEADAICIGEYHLTYGPREPITEKGAGPKARRGPAGR